MVVKLTNCQAQKNSGIMYMDIFTDTSKMRLDALLPLWVLRKENPKKIPKKLPKNLEKIPPKLPKLPKTPKATTRGSRLTTGARPRRPMHAAKVEKGAWLHKTCGGAVCLPSARQTRGRRPGAWNGAALPATPQNPKNSQNPHKLPPTHQLRKRGEARSAS
jgi:hypothetical protein